MQKEKAQIVKRKRDRQHLSQLSLKQFNIQDDPLWHQTPEMGAEALIAILDCNREIREALKKGIIKRKKLYREVSI